ncbi:MAG: GIY-YIG nuclease family protein [Nostocaceae cyanobacterium]|nr:GIY-YIG nuclease family protein [Nostocaceae cyanobacterium]
MIELEKIEPQTLPCLSLFERKNLPIMSAVYFVISSPNVIQYIGRTNNLRVRWQNHHRLNKLEEYEDCKIAWLEVSNSDLLPAIELALIEYFKPPLNRTGVNGKPKCELEPDVVDTKALRVSQFCERFDATLKRYRISAKKLSEETKVSENHISEFRRGKCDISTTVLLRLLDGMETLASDSKQHFYQMMSGQNQLQSSLKYSLTEIIQVADEDELLDAMSAIANRFRCIRNSSTVESDSPSSTLHRRH